MKRLLFLSFPSPPRPFPPLRPTSVQCVRSFLGEIFVFPAYAARKKSCGKKRLFQKFSQVFFCKKGKKQTFGILLKYSLRNNRRRLSVHSTYYFPIITFLTFFFQIPGDRGLRRRELPVPPDEDDPLPLQPIRVRLQLQEQGRHGEAQELPHEGRAAEQGRLQEVRQARRVRVRR